MTEEVVLSGEMLMKIAAEATEGHGLPPGEKVALELPDGSFAVKVQLDVPAVGREGPVGLRFLEFTPDDFVAYLHVGADGRSLGTVMTLDEVASRLPH